jgi:hypothetical protein
VTLHRLSESLPAGRSSKPDLKATASAGLTLAVGGANRARAILQPCSTFRQQRAGARVHRAPCLEVDRHFPHRCFWRALGESARLVPRGASALFLYRCLGTPSRQVRDPDRVEAHEADKPKGAAEQRAPDQGNVLEALSSASELEHVGLAEALQLCLLIREKEPARYTRAALRWHGRYCREVDVTFEEAQAVLAALVLLAGDRKRNAAFALAELLSRRGLERPCEALVAWARGRVGR